MIVLKRASTMRLATILLALGGVLAYGAGAQAAGLRAGGVLAGGSEERLAAAGRSASGAGVLDQGLAAPELRFGFTPRAGGSLLVDAAEEPEAGSLGLQLGFASGTAGLGRLDGLGLVPRAPSLAADGAADGLAVGGALAWAGWTLGGSYAFGTQSGTSLDLWTGQLGYGPVTARLGYGQEVAVGRLERELWLFGTDVATWSWLTLEGDVAVTAQPDREPTTVGRLGLRLNF
jgi:hypothetical protein